MFAVAVRGGVTHAIEPPVGPGRSVFVLHGLPSAVSPASLALGLRLFRLFGCNGCRAMDHPPRTITISDDTNRGR